MQAIERTGNANREATRSNPKRICMKFSRGKLREPTGSLLRPSGAGAVIYPMWEGNHKNATAEPKRQEDRFRESQRRRAGGAHDGRRSSFDPTVTLSDNWADANLSSLYLRPAASVLSSSGRLGGYAECERMVDRSIPKAIGPLELGQ